MLRLGRAGRTTSARRVHRVIRTGAFLVAVALVASLALLGGVVESSGASSVAQTHSRRLAEDGTLYPDEVFDADSLKRGAIVLHVIGVLYTFTGIAIVCDDFFVPALEVLVETYEIEDDVAGATFMAAGGSAPELFTAIIGVFIAKSNVGFGTIIGSAVFNVLFVIGACAFFSKELLVLTWWPLARDCTFYTFHLVMLYVFFLDQKIALYESCLLLAFYVMYVLFMKFNARVETWFKTRVLGKKDFDKVSRFERQRSEAKEAALAAASVGSGNRVSPMRQSSVKGLAKQIHRSGSRSGSLSATPDASRPASPPISNKAQVLTPRGETVPSSPEGLRIAAAKAAAAQAVNGELKRPYEDDDDDDDEGIDLSWPDDVAGRAYFILACPLMFLLAYTIPNCKKRRNLWPLVFVESILYIGFFSYFMVWWATTVGATVGISDEVMGYTFLAAGTSVPDLLSSVIVARQGHGDMAVSSSIGSNIFDITFGLPLPWMLWSLAHGLDDYPVNSDSLTFSLMLLIIMLVAIVAIIAQQGWKMTNTLGATMVFLYALFLTLVLLQSGGHVAGV